MGRKSRQWWPGTIFHIVSRGNHKDTLFRDHLDFHVFFQLLNLARKKVQCELYAYCIMINHFHLLMSTDEEPISKFMSWLNKRYADYYNNRYQVTGHLFEKRYYSGAVFDDFGILKVSRYIHRNPLKANIVQDPKDYIWSSYRSYISDEPKSPVTVHTSRILNCLPCEENSKIGMYRQYVETEE